MKKIGLVFKETSENQIRKTLKDTSGVFIVKYSGVSSQDLCALRQSLKQISAKLFVVKNSVARRALKASGLDTMLKAIEGPCGMVFAKDEPVAATKILYNFAKDHEKLKLEAGFMEGDLLDFKDIESIAKLPSMEVLRMRVVGTLKSPLSGLVIVLNSTLSKIVVCLEQIKKKKIS